MIEFTKHDNNGVILYTGTCLASQLDLQGENVVAGRGDQVTQYVANGQLCNYTEAEMHARMNMQRGQVWLMPDRVVLDQRSIEQVRSQAWERAKEARARAQCEPFLYAGKLYQSSLAIAEAAMQAQANPALTFTWRAQDNTQTTLDAAGMIELSLANFERNQAIRAKFDQVRQEIDACTDVAALDAGVHHVV